jgi:hypothetical protein
MTKRIYVITTGSYSDYRIVGHVQGNKTPALSTLWKQFEAEYGIYTRKANSGNFYFADMDRELKTRRVAIDRLKSEGYEGRNFSDLAGFFIDWLVKDHGFEEIKIMEWNSD